MKNCKHCDEPFHSDKAWAEFCCDQHRKAWHYQEKKRHDVEKAEAERAERVNGRQEEKIDLMSLGLVEPTPIPRRRIA